MIWIPAKILFAEFASQYIIRVNTRQAGVYRSPQTCYNKLAGHGIERSPVLYAECVASVCRQTPRQKKLVYIILMRPCLDQDDRPLRGASHALVALRATAKNRPSLLFRVRSDGRRASLDRQFCPKIASDLQAACFSNTQLAFLVILFATCVAWTAARGWCRTCGAPRHRS